MELVRDEETEETEPISREVDWDDMTIGELSHHIGKKMTEKVVKSKKTYTRKTKHKNKGISSSWLEASLHRRCSSVRLRYPPQHWPVRLSVRR